MSRVIRSLPYLAAFILPPLAAVALGAHALRSRERPEPSMDAPQSIDVARPELDVAKPTVVVVLGADLTEITDALGPYEMFSRLGTYNVVTAAPERRPTLLTGGLGVLPHFSLAEIDERLGERGPEIVVVPNIPNIAEPVNRPITAWLQKQAAAGAVMHSWCKGVMAFAEAGLLDGRTATAHWGDLPKLEKRYPGVLWVRGVRWVDHGQFIMSAGITSGIDTSLRLIGRLEGDAVADRIAREIRYPNAHFAKDPAAPQYTLRPADAVVLANAAFRVPRSRIGLGLYPGVGEIDLSNVYDTHAYTMVAEVEAVSETSEVVTSAHGMTFLPAIVLARSSADEARARQLDRLIMPGPDARSYGASLDVALAEVAPAVSADYLHADAPERFGLEPVLEDLARSSDVVTAIFAQRRMEYRSNYVHLEGSRGPWHALLAALLLGLSGLGVARFVRNRGRASLGAT